MEQKKRYTMIDMIRGLTICSMILFHATWDLVNLYDWDWPWFESVFAYVWQQSICWSFIFLSGFCWEFGSRHVKRGLTVLFAGLLVTIVTRIMMPDSFILFGVLTFLGSSMLVMIILDKVLKTCNPYIGAICALLLFVLTRNIGYGYLGFEQWNLIQLPKQLYANLFTTYFGFIKPGFLSVDYFGMFPWLFLFITGYFVHKMPICNSLMEKQEMIRCRWLEWMGKHSLLIYMIHQPLLYGILYVFSVIVQNAQ